MKHVHTVCRAIFCFATILILVAGWSLSAYAEKNCDIFAGDAIKQIKQAKKLGCGFTGSLWDDNYNGHKTWCLRPNISGQILIDTYFTRQRILDRCKKSKSVSGGQVNITNNCKAYAQRAVKKARLNIKLRCGYKTGNYADNYNGHFNWCMQQGILKASHADKVTSLGIAKCRKASKVSLCKQAATRAQSWRATMDKACRGIPNTSEWPGNWKNDFQLCQSKGVAFIDRENKRRKKTAAKCTRKKNTRTFLYTPGGKLRHYAERTWLPIDVCSNKVKHKNETELFNSCGKDWATELCKRFGYKKAIKIRTGTNDQSTSWNSARPDGPSTWWAGSKRVCHGKCGYFKAITCVR